MSVWKENQHDPSDEEIDGIFRSALREPTPFVVPDEQDWRALRHWLDAVEPTTPGGCPRLPNLLKFLSRFGKK